MTIHANTYVVNVRP